MKRLNRRARLRAERLRALADRKLQKSSLERYKARKARRQRQRPSRYALRLEEYLEPIQFLAAKAGIRRRRANSAIAQLNFPSTFSLFEDSDAVLEAAYSFVGYVTNPEVEGVHFRQDGCRNLDHGALALLNLVVTESERRRPLRLSGSFPSDDRLMRVVASSGLPRVLNVTGVNFPDIECFDLEIGGKPHNRAGSSTEKELAATRFVDYIKRCMARNQSTLSTVQEDSLLNMIGEVLGNVEDHSGRDRWWFSGHFEEGANGVGGMGQVVILNLGATIDETLVKLPTDQGVGHEVSTRVDSYLKLDASRRPADYRTFLALQQGISALRHVEDSRGQGTIRLLQFFARLSRPGSEPEMLIISGSTRVHVDQNEASKVLKIAPGGQFELPLNATGNLRQPPDPKFVHSISGRLPGTLVAFRFYL